jgi:hypothetical protein
MTARVSSIRPFSPPTAEGEAEVRRIVADYYGAWFDVDPERMARVLHPQLAKRGWVPDERGDRLIDVDTTESMVGWTRAGVGRRDDPAERAIDIRVVEVYDDIATALVHTLRYIETLQLVRTTDGWRILNALWREP